MINRHTPVAHAAYLDLLRSWQDETVSEIRGAPTPVKRNGKTYWYDSYRIGQEVRKTYIGEDSPELRQRLEHKQALASTADERRKHRARLIRILRAEGFLGTDATTGSLLSAMSRAGVFRLGGTIVGTQAFRLYEGTLGVRYSFDQMAQTGDLDIASFERLSLALQDTVSPPLQQVLSDFSFAPVPSLEQEKVWRWQQSRNELLVEFLTPSFEDDEGIRPLPALGVDAHSLHHLNYLIAKPIPAIAVYRSGILVQIPRPERFAIHKLIVADRRREGPESLKAHKDRMQAEFLILVLTQDRPDDLKEAYDDALACGPKWGQRIEQSLKHLPQTRAILNEL